MNNNFKNINTKLFWLNIFYKKGVKSIICKASKYARNLMNTASLTDALAFILRINDKHYDPPLLNLLSLIYEGLAENSNYQQDKVVYYDLAIETMIQSLKFEITPKSLGRLGKLFGKSGDLTSAINTYERSIAHFPDNVIAYYSIADIYFKSKDYDTALEYLLTAENIKSSAKNKVIIGHIYDIKGDFESSSYFYNLALNEGHNDFKTLVDFSRVCIRTNKPIKAIKLLEQALELEPYNLKVLNLLKSLYFTNEQYEKYKSIKRQIDLLENSHKLELISNAT